jgi:superoxide dismutase, Fe-Mn family
VNRRDSLKLALGAVAGIGAAGLAVARITPAQAQAAAPAAAPKFTLPPLGYAFAALEPHIDAETMMLHHDKHHGAYVANLNMLAERYADLGTKPMDAILANLDSVPEAVRMAVRNNLGGHWNHSFFWELMAPGGAKEASGDLKAAIDSTFTSVAAMADKVNAMGLARFGSGWAWLVVTKDKKLDIVSTANQDTPLEKGTKAVIGVDVWEHAYYLKYQNRRADYLKAWWNTVNWDKAAANFKKAAA